MKADFTFSASSPPESAKVAPPTAPSHEQMMPIYTWILGPTKDKPKIDLGPVTRAQAEQWLADAHAAYSASVGNRSHLLQRLKIIDRVEFVGLSDQKDAVSAEAMPAEVVVPPGTVQ